MRQVISQVFGGGGMGYAGNPVFLPFANWSGTASFDLRLGVPWSLESTIESATFRMSEAPDPGDWYEFTLYKGQSVATMAATGQVVRIDGPAVDGTIDFPIAVSPGDLLAVKLENNVANFSQIGICSATWVVNNPGKYSGYVAIGPSPQGGGAVAEALGAALGCGYISSGVTRSYSPINGTLTRMDVITHPFLDTAVAGDSRVFNIKIDGVVQDGSGGTANTTLTMDEVVALQDHLDITCPIAQGERVDIRWTAVDCVAALTHVSFAFEAENDGEFIVAGGANTAPDASVVSYTSTPGTFSTTESIVAVPIAGIPITLSGLWVTFDSNVGDGYDITLRQDMATPADAPTVTITGTNFPQLDSDPDHAVTFEDDHLFDLMVTPLGAGTLSVPMFWSFAAAVVTTATVGGGSGGTMSVPPDDRSMIVPLRRRAMYVPQQPRVMEAE